jgi:lipopolysaccharide exporter
MKLIYKILAYLKKTKRSKGSFLRGVLTMTTGTTIAQAIAIIFSPLNSRIYLPADYGAFALYSAVVAIISIFVCGRYELSIMLPEKDEDAIKLTRLSMVISISIAIATLLIIVFLSVISVYINYAIKKPLSYLYWVPPAVLLAGFYQTLNYWTNRKGDYRILAISRIGQTLSTSLATIGLGLLGTRAYGLIISSLLGLLISNIILLQCKDGRKLFLGPKISIDSFRSIAQQYKDFPLFSLPGALLDVVSNQLPIFLIGKFFSTSIVGLYSFSMKTLTIPVSLIGTSFSQVFYQKFAQNDSTPKRRISLLFNTWAALGGVSILPFLIIFFFGQPIFEFVFGRNWSEAGRIASILSPMLFVLFVSSPTSTTYTVLRLQHRALLFGIAAIIYRPMALYLGAIKLDLYFGLQVFVVLEIAQVVMYNFVILKKLLKDKGQS